MLGDNRTPDREPLLIRHRGERLEDELFDQRARGLRLIEQFIGLLESGETLEGLEKVRLRQL